MNKNAIIWLTILVVFVGCDDGSGFTKRNIQSFEGNNALKFQEGETVKLAGLPDNERTRAFIRENLGQQSEIALLWDSHYDNNGNLLAYIYSNGICLNTKAIQEGRIKAE